MISKALLMSAALALVTTAGYAGPQVTVGKDHRFVSVAPNIAAGKRGSPVQFAGSSAFSNFAKKYPNGLYFCCYGNTISGPSSFFGAAYAAAVQFTPASNTTVKKLSAGVGYVSGDHSVTLTLYADSGSNTPGAVLASGSTTTSVPYGACCGVTNVKIKGTSLTGGTPYWIAISTTGANFNAAGFSEVDQVNPHNVAYSSDGGATWGGATTTLPVTVAAK